MGYAIAWFVLVVVVFFFLVVRPQRRSMAAHQVFVANLELGDEVITTSGIYGTIRSLRDDTVELEIANGVTIKVARPAVARMAQEPAELEEARLSDP
jgi:preprotein translocase subunit YajC